MHLHDDQATVLMRSKFEPYLCNLALSFRYPLLCISRKDALYTTNLCVSDTGCLLDPPSSPLEGLGGLTPLRRGASKLAGSLTMPIGALRT